MKKQGKEEKKKRSAAGQMWDRFKVFRRSIYGRVVLIIAILSLFMYASFVFIFKSVYERHLNTMILQNGHNVGSLVEGALYHSMLENDKRSLQNILDVIHTLPGVENVNMYDGQDALVHTSYTQDSADYSRANCLGCHSDMGVMFPYKEKAYRIITPDHECMMNRSANGQRHLLIRSPILNSPTCYQGACHYHGPQEQVLGSLIIEVPLQDLDEAVNESNMQFFVLATLITLILATVLIQITKRQVRRPLSELIRASLAFSSGDRSTRVSVHANQLDDMKMVAHAFNKMLDHLEVATTELENWSHQLEYKVQKKSEELSAAQNELISIERLASLGKLSSSVAHEINNPLAGILVYTKLVHKQLGSTEVPEEKKVQMLKYLQLIEGETKRCGEIVKGLLDFSKKEQDDFEPRHLHELLIETCELMMHSLKIANIAFRKEFEATADLIFCSPNQIKQSCMAIVVNATEAVGENGEVSIRTFNTDNESITVEITDNGIGISPEDIPHIFEPFYSTKQETHGIGLGLAITHGIIQSHQGKLAVRSEVGLGTTISVTFPLIRS
ncbi:MAG TPA: ATP-binding protein [Bacteroidales bacterium]|nr:ATP-binding protein [Bacteroidales bacterium]HRZ77228.1 ATP-binding protein [Bacteroidales bacterium]